MTTSLQQHLILSHRDEPRHRDPPLRTNLNVRHPKPLQVADSDTNEADSIVMTSDQGASSVKVSESNSQKVRGRTPRASAHATTTQDAVGMRLDRNTCLEITTGTSVEPTTMNRSRCILLVAPMVGDIHIQLWTDSQVFVG